MAAAMMSGGDPTAMLPALGGAMMALTAYALLSTLTPPVFLIVSVSAPGFRGAFSASHWRGLFAGRLGDLVIVPEESDRGAGLGKHTCDSCPDTVGAACDNDGLVFENHARSLQKTAFVGGQQVQKPK